MMGNDYNMTKHRYTSDNGKVKREYLLDVNPWIWERVRGDGNNIIDARWIDVRNGLYIDITGIAETRPNEPGILNCKNYHWYKVSKQPQSNRRLVSTFRRLRTTTHLSSAKYDMGNMTNQVPTD